MSEQQNPIWTLNKECEVPSSIQALLSQNESVDTCYKSSRDFLVFTNRRIIFQDNEGIIAQKKANYSLPYSKIEAFSTQDGGLQKGTIEIFTRIDQFIFKIDGDVSLNKINQILASHI